MVTIGSTDARRATAKVNLRTRDFISVTDASPEETSALLARALSMKGAPRGSDGLAEGPLAGKTIALLFEMPSLRTRVSFEVAVAKLGGRAISLGPQEVHMGSREPARDIARVLSGYVDGIVCRTFSHETLTELARAASIPVVNALSNAEHPCQALADLMTILEQRGALRGTTIAFVGDGNNVAASLTLGAVALGATVHAASPPGYGLPAPITKRVSRIAAASGGALVLHQDPGDAARGADVLYTDVWTSMGQEGEEQARRSAFRGYQVNADLLARAKPDAIVMHPMPAHYGEEVPPDFLEHSRSVAYEQAGNRLYAQKALLESLFG